MITILLTGEQAVGKTSVWAPALKAHFVGLGLHVSVIDEFEGRDILDYQGVDVLIVTAIEADELRLNLYPAFIIRIDHVGDAIGELLSTLTGRPVTQRNRDRPDRDLSQWPIYVNPMPGEQRFQRCSSCKTYFGRFPYARAITPCLCGARVRDEESRPSALEKSLEHAPALQRRQSALGRALDWLRGGRSRFAALIGRAPELRCHSMSGQGTHQIPDHQPRSGKEQPSASPAAVENSSIAQLASTSRNRQGGVDR